MQLQSRPDTVPELIGFLKKNNLSRRRRAVQALARFGPAADSAVPQLARLLVHKDEWLRCLVARTLGQIGLAAEAVLVRALGDSSNHVRREAAWGLRRLDGLSSRAVAALAGSLADSDIKVKKAAALTLGALGPAASDAVPALIVALGEGSLVIRRLASWALFQIGSSAASGLTEALNSQDLCVRRAAIRLLEQIRRQGQDKVSTFILLTEASDY